MANNQSVKISDLFTVQYGNSLELINLTPCKSIDVDAVPFVSRTQNNNGVSAFVKKEAGIAANPAHALTVAVGGSVLSTFYQPVPFYTGFHILVLAPNKKMSVLEMLIYAAYIRANKYKYSYGRQANRTLKDILIPADIPAALKRRCTSYYKKMNAEISDKPAIAEKIALQAEKWEFFRLSELFEITGSKTTSLRELKKFGRGKYPYVTTQATDNGVAGFYDFYSEAGNVLTVDSAVSGYCAYQPLQFSASDHVEKLTPKFKMNRYIALFFTVILNLEQYRYNYGRKCSQTRMKNILVKLPCTENQVDFQYMENFIKSLAYSKSL